jgi:DNA polymerase elongation subunit (family B)
MMLQAKQELEDEPDTSKHEEIEKRIAKYSNIEKAKKVGLNSAYGALGSQYFRFYDLRMALGVTTAGKLSIRWIENKINQYMNKIIGSVGVDYVIASDTDSIYLRMAELVDMAYGKEKVLTISKLKVICFMDKVCEGKLQPFINESYQELADYVFAHRQKMEMKREGLSDRGIWTAKKRYILNVYDNEGVRYNEPDLKIMGLEMIKSSTPAVVRQKMKDLVNLIMNSGEQEVQDFITQFKLDFKKLSPEEISFPRGVNGIAMYSDQGTLYKKGTPIHVRGAIQYNHNLLDMGLDKKYPKIQEGEKIKFTYLKMPNPFKENVISFPTRLPPEFGIDKYVDYDTQFEKTFLSPIKVVVGVIGWKVEKVS